MQEIDALAQSNPPAAAARLKLVGLPLALVCVSSPRHFW
jgi:hypothetical protein